jgi:hypothetical protein
MTRIFAILLLTLSLASCSSISEKQYDKLMTKLASSSKMQKQETEACKAKFHNARQQVRKNMAAVVGVPQDQAVKVFCNRMVKALASRKLSYEDFVAGSRGEITPRILRLVQGKG